MKNTFPMDADILPPSDDRIFKVLLTHPNAKEVLIDVISTVIERKVIDVQVRNNEVPAMDVDEKNERFDINCTIDTGDQVNVEMHCHKKDEIGSENKNLINKCVYFLTDLHSSQKSVDVLYRNLVKTYQITFCLYNILPLHLDYVHRYTLRTEKGEQFTDQINMIFIELDKINKMLGKPVNELSSFEKWSLFFRFAQEPLQRKLINDIIKDKEEINMAASLLQEISQDERERAHAHSRKKARMDMFCIMEEARLKGHAEGHAEGFAEGEAKGDLKLRQEKLTIARNALTKGSTPEFVRDITGLSLEEIAKL